VKIVGLAAVVSAGGFAYENIHQAGHIAPQKKRPVPVKNRPFYNLWLPENGDSGHWEERIEIY